MAQRCRELKQREDMVLGARGHPTETRQPAAHVGKRHFLVDIWLSFSNFIVILPRKRERLN